MSSSVCVSHSPAFCVILTRLSLWTAEIISQK